MTLPKEYKSPVHSALRNKVLKKVKSDQPMTAYETAVLMIIEVEDAFKKGTKHFDINGNELETVSKVLEALNRDGKIEIQPGGN